MEEEIIMSMSITSSSSSFNLSTYNILLAQTLVSYVFEINLKLFSQLFIHLERESD